MTAGAVLCGGRSSRMGTDKAFVELAGVAMVQRVAAALATAGCAPVVLVGGDRCCWRASGSVWSPTGGQGPVRPVR